MEDYQKIAQLMDAIRLVANINSTVEISEELKKKSGQVGESLLETLKSKVQTANSSLTKL